MDDSFENAVYTYYHSVKDACVYFMEYVRQTENIKIHDKYEMYGYLRKTGKSIFVIRNRKYVFHGTGCTLFINNEKAVDWDFGYRYLWCGIDPYKMAVTLQYGLYEQPVFYDGEYIKGLCESYVSQGLMVCYKNQYYIDYLKKETQRITFPANYDTLVIKYNGKERIIPRSKEIDKFIRKSNLVYKYMEKLDNNYVLIFVDKGVETARVIYNDIAYPDSAVQIMNAIIKPNQIDDWL
ncbi:MAG: hypothetical protein IJ079_01345 [Lachnospiraceae bacterium]|nr:hypothetical protein [Lachnospiraceae bacterium]